MEIIPYVAGKSKDMGDIKPLKLSSNEGALGPSPMALTALQRQDSFHRYPDSAASEVREAISQRYDVPFDNIVCGAGSDELISLLIQAYAGVGDKVVYSQHGFAMYRISALANGAVPVEAPESEMRTDVDAVLATIDERTRLVFIANPNNPTGTYISGQEMARLQANMPSDCLLVIDGAYSEYVTAPDFDDSIALTLNSTNVVLTRTFSKMYAMGGLRLGWMVSNPEICGVMNRVRGPFNVSSAAIAAGAASMADLEFERASRQLNNQQLERVTRELNQTQLTVHPSVANFVLVDFHDAERAKAADAFLQAQGIFVREVSGYQLPTCLRLTLGTDDQMTRVIAAIKDFLRGEA